MRVAMDGTPLLGRRTGIGQYTAALVGALASRDVDLRLVPLTWRGARDLPDVAPPGVATSTRRVPARAVRTLWTRTGLPPAELITGRVDVVHGTNFVLPPPWRAGGVVTVHDLTFVHSPQWVSPSELDYRLLVPRALRRGAVVCTPTAAVRDEVRDAFALAVDRVVVTPLGVADAWRGATPATPQQLRAAGLPERYVLFLGDRSPRKNLARLLEAHAALRRADADVPPLVLVGPGDPPATAPGGAPGDVVAAGYLDAVVVRGAVAAAEVLVLPSRYEGFGLPVLEAMATGTAVVAADVPALREVGSEHARYADPTDSDALADALARTLADHGPTDAAQRRAHAAAWTWDACADATLDAYRRAAP